MQKDDISKILKKSGLMMTKNIEYLEHIARNEGDNIAQLVAMNFLASYVGFVLHASLTEKPEGPLTKQAKLEFTEANFLEMKRQVQEAIGAGFTGAMKAFTGKELDYYCAVNQVGPAINTRPI